MAGGYFTRTYEHWRSETTYDEAGQPIDQWTKQGDIAGRAYPATASSGYAGPIPYSEIDWIFATGADVDIQIGDQIRFNGRKLTVKVVPETSTGRRLEARCRELFV